MLTRIHVSYLGAETSLSKARDVMYWPTMNSEVKDFISDIKRFVLHAMITCKTTAKNH